MTRRTLFLLPLAALLPEANTYHHPITVPKDLDPAVVARVNKALRELMDHPVVMRTACVELRFDSEERARGVYELLPGAIGEAFERKNPKT